MVAAFAVAALLIAAVSAGIAALVSTERLDSRVQVEVARVEREQAAEDLRLEAEATAELARRSQARDDGECALFDAQLRQPAPADLRAAVLALRQRNLERAAPGSPCLLPIPEPGDPPRPPAPMPAATGGTQAPPATGAARPAPAPVAPAPATAQQPAANPPPAAPSPTAPAPPPAAPEPERGLLGDLTCDLGLLCP